MRFVSRWIVNTIAIIIATHVVPGIYTVGGNWGAVFVALTLAVVNATVKPVLQLLSLPITIFSLGFFHFVLNAALLRLSSSLAIALFGQGLLIDGFWPAIFAALVISIVSSLISEFIA